MSKSSIDLTNDVGDQNTSRALNHHNGEIIRQEAKLHEIFLDDNHDENLH